MPALTRELSQDLRYAARTLRSSPAFTLAAVLTLAIGIGANTAIFSAVDGVLLKPLPFAHADRIVTLWQTDPANGVTRGAVAPANFLDWRERSHAFDAMAVAEPFGFYYQGKSGTESIQSWNVSEDYFPVFGTPAFIGRAFQHADYEQGAPRVVVLSYGVWQRRFGADPSVVGRHVTISRTQATIVGVMPPGFMYPDGREAWAPRVFDEIDRRSRGSAYHQVVARLKPGVTIEQARADMDRISAQLAAEYPRTNAHVRAEVLSVREGIVGRVRAALVLLLGAVGLLLLIACANVANLLLARTNRRAREFAIRVALGADRRRVVRQLLTESLALAIVGGVAGVLIAYAGIDAIRALSPGTLPRIEEMHADWRALAFALTLSVGTTLVFGSAPALSAARTNLHDTLKAGGRALAGGKGSGRLRSVFVATEVALAVILLVGAGLLVRSFVSLMTGDRGYRSDHVLTATVFVWSWDSTASQRVAFTNEAIRRVKTIAGVVDAGATSSLPVHATIFTDRGIFTIQGHAIPAPGEEPNSHVTVLTPGVFDVLREPLRRGRAFTQFDDSSSARVAIVNEALVRRYFPNENPIGKRITLRFFGPPTLIEIVGVVGDVRQQGLDSDVEPSVFVPHAQFPLGSMSIVARTKGDPASGTRAVREAIASLHPDLPISISTLDDLLVNELRPRRFNLLLLAAFSVAALVLALVGVYGLMSNAATERTQEIGVRIALGARGIDVIGMVMIRGLGLACAGIVVGILASAALTQLLRQMLWSVTPLDGASFGAAAGLMLATTAIASFLPARRAAQVDPLIALREG
jgi:putative ABC transport system permease protein